MQAYVDGCITSYITGSDRMNFGHYENKRVRRRMKTVYERLTQNDLWKGK